MPQGRPRYRFAEFTLSPARRALFREGREVPLIPRYLDLLLMLVERRAVALHRQEIFDRVWSDVVVSDGALSQAVRTLRRTLGEGGDRPFIRTVSRHGYQFVCPVAEEEDAGEDAVPGTGKAAVVPAVPPGAPDPFAAALGRLLDPAATDEARRDAAEELHTLGTAEALRRLDRRPGHARAWAHLRDSRWDLAGAGAVPLLAAPAGPAAWAALARLRVRRALRLAGSRWAGAAAGKNGESANTDPTMVILIARCVPGVPCKLLIPVMLPLLSTPTTAVTARDATGRSRNKSFYLGKSESRGKSRQVADLRVVDEQALGPDARCPGACRTKRSRSLWAGALRVR